MQTIKTGIVVALLLAVCYGAFVALNAPDAELPSELVEWAQDGQLDSMVDIEIPSQAGGGSSTADLSSLPNSVFPSVALPATLPAVTLPEAQVPAMPNLDLNGAPVGATGLPTSAALPPAADGPAIKLPPTLGATDTNESNSLLVDPVPSQTRASFVATEYPAIPLADPKHALAGSGQTAAADNTTAAPSATASQPSLPPFSSAREQALKQANNGDLKGALSALSAYYRSPELPHAEHTDLLEILDALAREVIYSQRHLVVPAYVANAGETIANVATKHHITSELLSSINQLKDAHVLIQGQQIKVVEGPFRGEVDLTRSELTVFLKDMYAGRFPITTGENPVPRTGHFEVADKRRDRNYYGAGNFIRADDPQNPYGGYWIDLGLDMCIHGSAEMATSDLKTAGCISLSPIDAADIYNMLSQGSQIDIYK